MYIKKLNIILIYTFLSISVLFLGSCNLFFSSPHGRENLNDEAAQITAFAAVPFSDKSVVTMWNWREPPSWLSDDRITEIRIQHSIFGYPENYIFFAGESFTDNDVWQHEWKDLIPGITHYFSLFAKSTDYDGNNIWYAPIKAKIKLQDVTEISGKNYSVVKSLNVNDSSSADVNPGALDINYSTVAVIYFDFDNSYVTQASISFYVSNSDNPGDIEIIPLIGYLPDDDMEKWNLLNNNTLVNIGLSKTIYISAAVTFTLDISDIVRFSPLNHANALLIRTTDGTADLTLDNSASAPYIIADIIK